MDSYLDIERQKLQEYYDAVRQSRRDYCEECEEHNETCPYYDSEEESWDYDLCYEERL